MTTPIKFAHDGKDYELRATFDGQTARVRAFTNGQPANGFEYSVSIPLAYEPFDRRGDQAAAFLLGDAKRDVVEGRWEKLLGAITR